MDDILTSNELTLLIAVLIVSLAAIYVCEQIRPKRHHAPARATRWTANVTLGVAGETVSRFSGYALLLTAAWLGIGDNAPLFPPPINFLATILLLDLTHYAIHRFLHSMPWLWRIHRVHHSDLHVDLTTGLRHHPLEALVVTAIVLPLIWFSGLSLTGAIFYQLVTAVVDTFNHGNIALPQKLDALLRRCIVTPDMHRVHHSARRAETDSNFGGLFPWWDRLFSTYRAAPATGHRRMRIGLDEFRGAHQQRLVGALLQPFK